MGFKKKLPSYIFLTLFFVLLTTPGYAVVQKSKFTLVIDAGHGGHDPGALGSFSQEKNINLAISLKLGKLIEKNCKDVKVIFTRKTDVYLTLQQRADIVNNNHADLFICIHTNSSPNSSVHGAATFTLGLAKTKANLAVAMRENSVILLENNYKTKYKGFDPSSVDSYIMFEFMQDNYIDRSVKFGQEVQEKLREANRADRGVRQAGFWVLFKSACPSVLIEVGFISNHKEEKYLNSQRGQNQIAGAIYKAFLEFKKDHYNRSGLRLVKKKKMEEAQDVKSMTDSDSTAIASTVRNALHDQKVDSDHAKIPKVSTPVAKTDTISKKVEPVYKIQIFALKEKLKSNSLKFKGLKNPDYFREKGFYKYTVGSETDYHKILSLRKDIASKFPHSFIIAFMGNKKISVKDALKISNK